MADSCPIQAPDERARGAVVSAAAEKLLATVVAAIEAADASTLAELRTLGVDDAPSFHGYLMSSVHQKLYCLLCGADPATFAGGNATTARALIRNSQQIARHYWGAAIEVSPRA